MREKTVILIQTAFQGGTAILPILFCLYDTDLSVNGFTLDTDERNLYFHAMTAAIPDSGLILNRHVAGGNYSVVLNDINNDVPDMFYNKK